MARNERFPIAVRLVLFALVATLAAFPVTLFADSKEPESVPAEPSAPTEPLGEPAPDAEEAVSSKHLGGRPIAPDAARLTEEGMVLMRKRHFAESVEAFKRASDEDPKHPVVWNNLGSAYLSMGETLKARRAFQRAISLDPNYAMAHYNLGAVLDGAYEYDAAIESYARALELDPELGTPAKNPAVVNNAHLAAVHLVLYKRQVGSLGTGITPVTEAGEKPKPSSAP